MEVRYEQITGFRIFMKNRKGMLGLLMLSLMILLSIFADYLAPYNAKERIGIPYDKPSSEHLLGTNDVGQDIFSRLIVGSRVTLLVGFASGISVITVGTILGLFSGYIGGLLDEFIMRCADVIMIIPTLTLLILITTFLKSRSFVVIIALMAVTSWSGTARMIRSQVLSLKERTYIKGVEAVGGGDIYIIFKHILPNVAPLLLSGVIGMTGAAMLSEAGLSFLGLGDPINVSWGQMLNYAHISGGWWINNGKPAWWWILSPGLMIAYTTLSIFLIGQGVEEVVNPRLRRR